MKDRVPTSPGRVLITPENGAAAFYATMTRADDPTQEGDPLNKRTFLTDATAALFGLSTNAVPDDVLNVLSRFHAGLGNEHIWERSDGSYVNSPNANAYPPSVDDGYTYVYLGPLGNRVQVATGSYTGTGTSGVDNPNSLTFDFAPKIVWIYGSLGSGAYDVWNNLSGSGSYKYLVDFDVLTTTFTDGNGFGYRNSTNSLYGKKSEDGKTVSWYYAPSDSGASNQLNSSGEAYYYIAIGFV